MVQSLIANPEPIIKKMFRVFDELHSNIEVAKKVLKGWEHKEKITEVYAVGYPDNLQTPVYDLKGIYLAHNEIDAIEEMKALTWN